MPATAQNRPRGHSLYWGLLALAVLALGALWLRPAPVDRRGPQESPAPARAPTAAVVPARVAVFPFTASPVDPAAAPLRHGLAEILIQRLGSSGEVEAVGRQSVLGVTGLGLDRAQAAVLLDAAFVLDGRLEVDGERLRLEVEFHDMSAGARLWVGSYEGELALLQRLPDLLERRVRDSLRGETGRPATTDDRSTPADVPLEAHLAYLKGRFAADRRTPEGLQRSLEWFERAVALAPGYAAAWTGIAQSQHLLVWYAGAQPADAFPLALAAAERALALDPGAADAAAVTGLVLWTYRRDLVGAELALRHSLTLNPASADALHALAQLLALTGRREEADPVFQRALQIEPLSLVMRTDYGSAWLWNGDPATALEHYHYVLQLDPDFALAHLFAGLALHAKGQPDQAIGRLERAVLLGGDPPLWRASLARSYATAGRGADARAMLARLEVERRDQFVSPVALALIHLALGDRAMALAELSRGLEDDDPLLIYLLSYPDFLALHGEPGFESFVARTGLRTHRGATPD